MENDQPIQDPTPEDIAAARSYKFQIWKERVYRFFYNIWPGINRFLSGFFYLLMRIIKGFIKTAMEEIRH